MVLPLTVTGTVKHGNGEAGRVFHFPTANLYLPSCPLEPGIYAGKVETGENLYDSVICYGVEEGKFEAHLFDFSDNLYDKQIKVEVIQRIADLIPYKSISEMKTFIYSTAEKAQVVLKER